MKIHSGFISNSSSSSFIIVGTLLTEKLEKQLINQFDLLQEDIDEMGIAAILEDDEKFGLRVLYTSDSSLTIGKVIDNGGEHLKNGALTIEELTEHVNHVKKVLGEDAPVKLIYGTRPS
jgi:hypothetical protein